MSSEQGFPEGEVKRRILDVLHQISGLPEKMYRSIPEDVEAGELAVAFEFMCDQAEVYRVPLTSKVKAEIFDLGVVLHMRETADLIADNPEL